MPNLVATSALLACLTLLPAIARGQEDGAFTPGVTPGAEAVPEEPAPAWNPPPPADAPAATPSPQAAVPPGQWVYTQQYGWIWMPYADAYTRVPGNGWGEPYAYVYAPAYSAWAWVAAPWIWGYGPWPVFGTWGAARFGWYGHGWWRSPARWHYAPARGWYGGWRAAPLYGRGGWGAPRFAPARPGLGVVRGMVGGPAVFRGRHGGHDRW